MPQPNGCRRPRISAVDQHRALANIFLFSNPCMESGGAINCVRLAGIVIFELSKIPFNFSPCIARSSAWNFRYPFLQLSVSDSKPTYPDLAKRLTQHILRLSRPTLQPSIIESTSAILPVRTHPLPPIVRLLVRLAKFLPKSHQ